MRSNTPPLINMVFLLGIVLMATLAWLFFVIAASARHDGWMKYDAMWNLKDNIMNHTMNFDIHGRFGLVGGCVTVTLDMEDPNRKPETQTVCASYSSHETLFLIDPEHWTPIRRTGQAGMAFVVLSILFVTAFVIYYALKFANSIIKSPFLWNLLSSKTIHKVVILLACGAVVFSFISIPITLGGFKTQIADQFADVARNDPLVSNDTFVSRTHNSGTPQYAWFLDFFGFLFILVATGLALWRIHSAGWEDGSVDETSPILKSGQPGHPY